MSDDQALAMLMKVCATVIVLIFAGKEHKKALKHAKNSMPSLANIAIAYMVIYYSIAILIWFR